MSNRTPEFAAGYADYTESVPYDNPATPGTAAYADYDQGYWSAHADSFEASTGGGIEEAYGNWAEDYGDDDPSPYSGTYSEE